MSRLVNVLLGKIYLFYSPSQERATLLQPGGSDNNFPGRTFLSDPKKAGLKKKSP